MDTKTLINAYITAMPPLCRTSFPELVLVIRTWAASWGMSVPSPRRVEAEARQALTSRTDAHYELERGICKHLT